ncbi:iron hydrogenase small subunit [Candidatus Peregrinibacteria bacterium]|nr:iron hydrogenase small subunit [Candidatus Peregrinibacteria bacterium]
MTKAAEDVINLIKNKGDKILTVQIAPAVRVALGEYLGYEPGTNVIGNLIGSLRQLGFNYIFDTNFGADITVMEEAAELVERLKTNKKLPMFTTCCPTWYTYVERLYPELIPYLSTLKSPQAVLASIIKTYFAEKMKIPLDRLVHVVLAPCEMKKEEARKKEIWVYPDQPNIDYVLTTKEFAELIQEMKIDFKNMPQGDFDNPLGISSGAGAIFATTGGVMEAVVRTAYFLITGKDLKKFEITGIRNAGLKREGSLTIANFKIDILTVNSLHEITPILNELKTTGKSKYEFIEVMNCPMGCIGGTGQWTADKEILAKRRAAIFAYDKEHSARASHQNEYVKQIYKEYFERLGSKKARQILHTQYVDRSEEDAANFTCEFPPKN